MRNSLARRVLWVHVILLLALCGVLLRIFVIGQGEQYRQTAAAQSRYTLSAGTARGNIYDCRLRPLVNESEKTVLAVDPTGHDRPAARPFGGTVRGDLSPAAKRPPGAPPQ